MGQPYQVILDNSQLNRLREQTLGSKTFQYQEEKRPNRYSLSSGERNGKSTNSATKSERDESRGMILGMGVIRLQR